MPRNPWVDVGPGDETEVCRKRDSLGRYWYIELMNYESLTGEPQGGKPYWIELSIVDVLMVDPEPLSSALDYTGAREYMDDDRSDRGEHRLELCVEALFDAGVRGRVWSEAGSNWREMMRQAKREQRHLSASRYELDRALDQPANQLGQTARCFMMGSVGFSRSQRTMERNPRELITDYAQHLERRILKRDEEIRRLQEEIAALKRGGDASQGTLRSQADV